MCVFFICIGNCSKYSGMPAKSKVMFARNKSFLPLKALLKIEVKRILTFNF